MATLSLLGCYFRGRQLGECVEPHLGRIPVSFWIGLGGEKPRRENDWLKILAHLQLTRPSSRAVYVLTVLIMPAYNPSQRRPVDVEASLKFVLLSSLANFRRVPASKVAILRVDRTYIHF